MHIFFQRVSCLLFFSLLLPGMVRAEKGTGSSDSLQRQLAGIQAYGAYQVGGDSLYFPSVLSDLYHRRDGNLLWHQGYSIDQLFTAIEVSAEEGLIPNEYHLQTLLRLRQLLSAGEEDPSLRADFDLLLTDAFIRLAYDKGFGKVDPDQLHGDWNLPKRNGDYHFVGMIEETILSGTVGETLAALSPQLPGYTVLKQALGRYRNIRERGGWPSLAAGPTLNPGDEGERVLILRWRLVSTGDLSGESLDSPVFDEELKEAVLRFQHRHYLEEDGLVGKQTLAALNQSIDEKIDQIRVNLERLRWLSHDKPDNCILIDIAGYTLTLHLGHDFTWSTRVVVGKPYHKTPTLAAAIKYLVINPTWTIPRSIFRNEVLPKIKKDSSYLQKENLQVVTPNGRVIPRSSINWYNHTGRSFPYLLRQTPGPHNALGRIKFIFPNKHSVYLHDTPHRKLFEKEQRAFSHGCIRVDKPLELAEIILKNDGQDWDLERLERVIASRKIKTVYLNQPLPIMLLYWTVNASDAQTVSFKHDVYGRDQLLLEALDGGFDPRRNIFQVPKWGEEVELHGSK